MPIPVENYDVSICTSLPIKNFSAAGEQTPADKSKSGVVSVVGEIVFYLLLVVAVLAIYLFGSSQSGKPKLLFGYSAMTILTGSMQTEIPKGSLIITKQVDSNTIKLADDITFMVDDHTSVTHRVIGIYENYEETGERGFQTQGVSNLNPDLDITYASNVVGKVIYHNETLGIIISFIKHYPLYIGLIMTFSIGLAISLRIVVSSGKKESELGIAGARS